LLAWWKVARIKMCEKLVSRKVIKLFSNLTGGFEMKTRIFDLLKADHKKVATLLAQLADTTTAAIKTREKLFKKLVEELNIHQKFEEEFFYPKIKQNTEKSVIKDLVEEAYQEHHVVKGLLTEMQDLPVEDEVWTAKLTVLKENIEHHVQEEENDLFPKAEKTLDASQLEQMAGQFMQLKKSEVSSASYASIEE
jgi:iron-sulfur cluster repair protein YtfE (RIC family)